MKIIYLKPLKEKGYLRLGIDTGEGKEGFNLSEKQYGELGCLLSGDEITDEELSFIRDCDMRYRAFKKALSILAFSDNSERRLYEKLIRCGISRAIAKETVSEVLRLGYIDSHRQLSHIITNEVNLRNTGPAKLAQKLMAKGYLRSDIESVISELKESGEIDFEAAKERLLLSKDACDEEEKKKILYKNGYNIC